MFCLHLSKVCVCGGVGGGEDRVIEYFRQFPAFCVCVLFFSFLRVPINFVIIFLSCGNLKRDLDKYSAVFYVTLT